MTLPVIDQFQVIHVQQQHGERMMAAFGTAQFTHERVHEFAVVRQSGECIVRRLVADLLFRPLSLRDIEAHPNAPYDFTGRCPQWLQLNFQHAVLPLVLEPH